MDKTPEQLVREALEAGQPKNHDWKENDTVVGRIMDGFVAPTQFKDKCLVLTLLQDDGERVNVWLSNDILEKKVQDRRPQMGDTIGIQRLGTKVSAGGREYVDWNVVVHGTAGKELPFLGAGPVGGESRALGAPVDEPAGVTYGRGEPEEAEVVNPTGDVYTPPSSWS